MAATRKKTLSTRKTHNLDFSALGRVLGVTCGTGNIPEKYRVPDERKVTDLHSSMAEVRQARAELADKISWVFTRRYVDQQINAVALSNRCIAVAAIEGHAEAIRKSFEADEVLMFSLGYALQHVDVLDVLTKLHENAGRERGRLDGVIRETSNWGNSGSSEQPSLIRSMGDIFTDEFGGAAKISDKKADAPGPFGRFVQAIFKEIGLPVPSSEAIRKALAR